MRIAYVISKLCVGGAERVTVNLCNYFVEKNNNDIFLFTRYKSNGEYNLNPLVNRFCVLKGNLLLDTIKLLKLFNKYKIDIAVGMEIYTNFCLSILSLFSKTKIIISERNSPWHDLISLRSKILRKLVYWLSDAYVFQNKTACSFYSQGIQNRSVIIPNPIKTDLPFKSQKNNKEIISVGRLSKQKNFPMLLKAFAIVHEAYPDYTLRIFGQGPELETLKNIVKEHGLLKYVFFEGYSDNIHEMIKDSSIFVMSSDFEGMPNSLMEAMAMGFPAVATDCPCGGPADLIKNNYNGCLISVGDFEDMAEKIIDLINDNKKMNYISKNAMSIRDRFSIQKIGEKWLNLFSIVIK